MMQTIEKETVRQKSTDKSIQDKSTDDAKVLDRISAGTSIVGSVLIIVASLEISPALMISAAVAMLAAATTKIVALRHDNSTKDHVEHIIK